ncbi:MAG: sialate O-acetylesterase [Sedimentisphaeraceae bacterium JB056]
MKKLRLLVLVLISGCICLSGFADVKLPAIISDNMALQQNAEVNIWGWADAGEKVTVEANWGNTLPLVGKFFPKKVTAETVADEQGNWSLKINTPKAGGPYSLKVKGNNEITVSNILIGELWLCSGQSNMSMPMGGWDKQPIIGGPEDIANSANDKIRLFTVDRATADEPLKDVSGKWVLCNPETVKAFSAVGYYFGRKVQNDTGLPVGLISSNWGGTLAEAWTREEFIAQDDQLNPLIPKFSKSRSQWEEAATKAKAEGKPAPRCPGGSRPQDKPATLYNAMIAPITNMTIKGAIWYQGESNAGKSYQYRRLFPVMINNWRCDFDNPDMPFYFVQLANYYSHKPGQEVEVYSGEPRDHGWAELREAQLMTCDHKNNGMAVIIDIGEANNIHPGNKKDVGERLARWALVKDYGFDMPFSGPLYAGYFVEGDKIRVKFKYADNGLMTKGDKPVGFAIAGSDRKFVWADAVIDGSDIVVSSDKVKEPVAVRYAWDIYPDNDLYNAEGLPASPFRTDDWNGETYGRND